MMQGLVVDDSRVMRQVALQILEKLSFTVEEAQNCEGAMTVCRRVMPDVMMLDLNMPNSNIAFFIRNVRRSPAGEKPYILICATENDALLLEALESGGDDYVLKPYDYSTIEAKLQEAGVMGEAG
jgi:two-component system, chemotaxis family, chemotaxis protein CheY